MRYLRRHAALSDYDQKYAAALAELTQTEMWPSNYAPPLHKVQRLIGMQPRLPHCESFWRVLVGSAIWFGVVWCILMWFLEWRAAGVPFGTAVGSSAIAGLFFGVAMAGVYAWGRRRWQLSRWDEL